MCLSLLDTSIKNILSAVQPSDTDNANRAAALKELQAVIQSIESGATAKSHGSYEAKLHSKWSDMDVSVQGLKLTGLRLLASDKYGFKKEALTRVKRALQRKDVAQNIEIFLERNVPLVKYESKMYNVKFDVTIDNHVAPIKSEILRKLQCLDSRFRDLFLLVKEWAKTQGINNAQLGTLNSYTICFLVIFHLQTCDPPILPPLCKIYEGSLCDDIAAEGYQNSQKHILEKCDEKIAKFKSETYKSRNMSSLSQLLRSFFHKFSSIGTQAQDNIIVPYHGHWKRTQKPIKGLFIEDPFHRSNNTSKAVVGPDQLRKISKAFTMTNEKLSCEEILSSRNSILKLLATPDSHRLMAHDTHHQQQHHNHGC